MKQNSGLDVPSSFDARPEKTLIDEAHEDLNETKRTVNDLLNYKRSLMEAGGDDLEKINEIKSRAIEAINNLFNDIITTKKA